MDIRFIAKMLNDKPVKEVIKFLKQSMSVEEAENLIIDASIKKHKELMLRIKYDQACVRMLEAYEAWKEAENELSKE